MIVRGYFRIFSFFDVAEAFRLESLQAILGPEAAPRAPAFTHRTPDYAQVQNAPIIEAMAPVSRFHPARNWTLESNITGLESRSVELIARVRMRF